MPSARSGLRKWFAAGRGARHDVEQVDVALARARRAEMDRHRPQHGIARRLEDMAQAQRSMKESHGRHILRARAARTRRPPGPGRSARCAARRSARCAVQRGVPFVGHDLVLDEFLDPVLESVTARVKAFVGRLGRADPACRIERNDLAEISSSAGPFCGHDLVLDEFLDPVREVGGRGRRRKIEIHGILQGPGRRRTGRVFSDSRSGSPRPSCSVPRSPSSSAVEITSSSMHAREALGRPERQPDLAQGSHRAGRRGWSARPWPSPDCAPFRRPGALPGVAPNFLPVCPVRKRASRIAWPAPLEPRGYIGCAASPSRVIRPKLQRGSGSRSTMGYSRISPVLSIMPLMSSQSNLRPAKEGMMSASRPRPVQSWRTASGRSISATQLISGRPLVSAVPGRTG